MNAATEILDKHLFLWMGCQVHNGSSYVRRQYVTYPYRLSRPLALAPADLSQYFYIMNSSPGLLAKDNLRIALKLDTGANLYLTDQSATKVHSMPGGEKAKTCYEIEVGDNASLELECEPLIFYPNSALEQSIKVLLHPTAQLFISEIIVPGRLARGEFYDFQYYLSRMEVSTPSRELIFADTMQLDGKSNPFCYSKIFSSLPIIANLMLVLPEVELKKLSKEIESFIFSWKALGRETAPPNFPLPGTRAIALASSPLPNCNGLIIRVMAANTGIIKTYIQHVMNCARRFSNRPALPEIPK
jgi:urease accessory protein